MKKLLVLALVITMLVGCGPKAPKEEGGDTPSDVAYKVGVGSFTTVSGTDAGEKDGQVQVNTTYAGVVLDADGKIVYVTFDVAQNTGKFDATGKTLVAADQDTRTKVEKGLDYNMKPVSEKGGIGKELFEQLDALEAYAVGKTVEEFLAIPTMDKEDGSHTEVPTGEDLTSSVTITIGDFKRAIEKAAANAVEVKNVSSVGVGSFTSVSGKDAGEKAGSFQTNVTYVIIALDAEGKVLHATFDVAQNTGTYDATGKSLVTAEIDTRTKVEKGLDYNMKPVSEKGGIGKELFEQVEALNAYAVGKTVAEFLAIPTMDKEDGSHTEVPTAEDLTSSVTITIGDYKKAIEKANTNAVKLGA